MKIIFQQANTSSGDYDVNLPVPYPVVVNLDTGYIESGLPVSAHLIGFQATAVPDPTGVLLRQEVVDPQQVVGMFPVFGEGDGMWNSTLPIESARAMP